MVNLNERHNLHWLLVKRENKQACSFAVCAAALWRRAFLESNLDAQHVAVGLSNAWRHKIGVLKVFVETISIGCPSVIKIIWRYVFMSCTIARLVWCFLYLSTLSNLVFQTWRTISSNCCLITFWLREFALNHILIHCFWIPSRFTLINRTYATVYVLIESSAAKRLPCSYLRIPSREAHPCVSVA